MRGGRLALFTGTVDRGATRFRSRPPVVRRWPFSWTSVVRTTPGDGFVRASAPSRTSGGRRRPRQNGRRANAISRRSPATRRHGPPVRTSRHTRPPVCNPTGRGRTSGGAVRLNPFLHSKRMGIVSGTVVTTTPRDLGLLPIIIL